MSTTPQLATSRLARPLETGPSAAERWRDLCRDLLARHGVLVVRLADLNWDDRELAKAMGERIYGRRAA